MKKKMTSIILFLSLVWMAGCASPTPVPVQTFPSATVSQDDASTPTRPTPTLLPTAMAVPGFDNLYLRTLTVGSLERKFLYHLPSNLDSQRPTPIVFFFHGYGMEATFFSSFGFNAISDVGGFIAVYPYGTGPAGSLSFNSWHLCCGYAAENNVDDTAFVHQMLTDLGTTFNIDPKRIYASGFSNGAEFAYRLACEMSATFAAVAPVAGILGFSPCQPQQPISILHVHGLADPTVVYKGGVDSASGTKIPSVEESIAAFVTLDGCPASPTVKVDGVVTHAVYAGCKNGTAVELYTIKTGGHTWQNDAIPTNQIIWDFFASHPKQS